MRAGSVVTISPRVHLGDLERLARTRLARYGVAVFAAVTADGRQRHHLRKLGERLAGDPAFEVHGGPQTDGTTSLIVFAAGGPRPGWFGGPKTG